MSLINAFAEELERESHTTRKMLERVPLEKIRNGNRIRKA
jgi:hypothetical protein